MAESEATVGDTSTLLNTSTSTTLLNTSTSATLHGNHPRKKPSHHYYYVILYNSDISE